MRQTIARTRQAALNAGRAALDLVLPPRCLACGVVVADAGGVCVACWRALNFVGPPQCGRCGYPFDYDTEPDALCPACLDHPPVFDRARAVFAYDQASRRLVLGFKHADATHAAPAFGRWMARAGAPLLAEADLLAPVPLHRWRLFARRYNQAGLLCQQVRGALEGRRPRLILDLLTRTRRTASLGTLDPAARRRRVRGAFAVKAPHLEAVRDQRVLLVDDVLTTGATANACAEALLNAGAAAVDVLTLARVPRLLPVD